MYGGKVDVGPEIVHGKVSKVTHDGTGCVLFVPQQSINDALYHGVLHLHFVLLIVYDGI